MSSTALPTFLSRARLVTAVVSVILLLLLGILLICSVIVIGANILVDLAYAWLDPRIELA